MADLPALAGTSITWPNVPACYHWLSLDRRGDWRLQGERVSHAGLIAFLNQQYDVDATGCWFVQNGPQRVFVDLAYTPWVFRLTAAGLQTHTGQPAGAVEACFLDDAGSALIATNLGIGLLDDRDLPAFLDACRQTPDAAVDEENWLKLMTGAASADITWHQRPVHPILQHDVPRRFNFQPHPQP